MKKLIYLILLIVIMTGCSNKNVSNPSDITNENMVVIDYSSSKSFEKALNNQENVNGKVVKFLVKDYSNHEIIAGDNLKFITNKELDIIKGSYLIVKVKGVPEKENDKWIINFDLIKNEDSDITTPVVSTDENKEEDNLIKVPNASTYYVGKNKDEIEKELKNLGFTNIKLVEVKTSDSNNKDNYVSEITIDNKGFLKDDTFKKDVEVIVKYWKYDKPQNATIVLPKDDSKLAKDFDSKSDNCVYYLNVDGVKNVPTIKKWNNISVTDSIYDYLEYLKGLGFKVEVTSNSVKEPYAGYHFYEANFKVSNDNISWTMYMSIQDEKYVEYELDINLK